MTDIRYALRRLLRERVFSLIAVGTLALGVAVLAAAAALIDAVLLQPLVEDQNRVVRIWKSDVARDDMRHPFSYPEFLSLREASQSFTSLSAIQYGDANAMAVALDDESTVVMAAPVSPEFLPTVTSTPPLHGRWFSAEDDRPGGDLQAVVSARWWRRVAGADPAFVGRRLRMHDGRHMIVTAVAPDEVDYPIGTDIWIPIGAYFDGGPGRVFNAGPEFVHFELVGRLRPGVSREQARSELDSIDRRVVASLYPDASGPMAIVATPVIDALTGESGRAMWFLFAGAGLVLVAAGVNVAALLLMRGVRHRQELAVRLALGATRFRLARDVAVDSLILGLLSAVAGVALAQGLLALVQWIEPGGMPRVEHAALDVRVLAVATGSVLLWVVTLGTAPAWTHRRLDPARVGDLSSRGQARANGLRFFTVAEIAIAVAVSIVAGLLLRSFVNLQAIDRGFDSANLAIVPLQWPEDRYPDARSLRALYSDLIVRLEATPGVLAATPFHNPPGSANAGLSARMLFEGQTADEAKSNPYATFDPVTPSYFRTFGIPIRQGRAFTHADRADSERVAIVSEAVAQRYWPGQDPIGKRVRFDDEFPAATVVGVAGETRYRELTKMWMTVYFPAEQFFYFRPMALAVRSATTAPAVVPAIRAAVREREPTAAIHNVTTMDTMIASEVSRQRTTFAVMLLFATITVILAVVGVYGVLSYDVSQRRHELAVRSALGASPARLFRRVVRHSLGLGVAGTALGLAGGLILAPLLTPLLHEVSPIDRTTFVTAACLLLTAACLAAIAPGVRAARSARGGQVLN